MTRKSILLLVGSLGVLVAGFMVLPLLSQGTPYSTHYRHTMQTQVTVRTLATALGAFQSEFGSLPAGENGAVLRQLLGENPRKMPFVTPPKLYNAASGPAQFAADAEGRIVDGWNTPLRFKLGTTICIESAGEDRKFDTPDDIVETLPGR
jgi:hypothetical protein